MMKTFSTALVAGIASAAPIVGTNIGGWMVLEPWITPSLFYRFLGKTHSEGVGMDSYTLCEALGPEEGNKVMRDHWDSWVTKDLLQDLKDRNVEVIRVPIGDWTTVSYGPYIGCMDGAAEKIEELLDWSADIGLKVLLDVHAMKDSQNGFDNSGMAWHLEWTDENHFKHWSIEAADWMGEFDLETGSYKSINWDHIDWAVNNVQALMDKWGNHPAMYALEPVNEPWWASDLDVLKEYYRRAREVVRTSNPDTLFVFHDSFHTDAGVWNDLFADDDMENVVMDTHQYMAWWEKKNDIGMYCDDYEAVFSNFDDIKYPVWVGEWALATDVCAMWLGGFNDSNTEYQFECEWVDCPAPYLPEATAVDLDRSAASLGPFGESRRATVDFGKCARDSTWFRDCDVAALGECVYEVFDKHVAGHFIWTARNELEDKWNYVNAFDNGWTNPAKFGMNPCGAQEFIE